MRRALATAGAPVAVLAAYWGAVTLGSQFAIAPPGRLHDVWYSATPGLAGLLLGAVVAFAVGRWLVLPLVLGVLVRRSLGPSGLRYGS